jgi:heat shock protein HslJ
MRQMTICAIAAIAALGFSGQALAEDPPPKPIGPAFKNFPLDQTWSLRTLNDKAIPSGLDVSLKIDGNLRGSGYTGCNSWSASLYPVKDQKLLMGPIAITKKQCDKDIMAVETGFLGVLLGNPAWDLVNGELVIKGARGALHFDRSL